MRALCVLIVLAAAIGGAQTAEENALPAFDVVSVKHDGNTHVTIQAGGGPVSVPTRPFKFLPTKVTCKMPLSAMIEEAYGVKSWQLVAPEWVGSELYDFAGVMPEGTSREDARLMLRRALAERFGLKLRRDPKLAAVYSLVMIPGTNKLEEVLPTPATYGYRSGRDRVEADPGMPLRVLADHLSWAAGRPVIDDTRLTGFYKVRLRWEADSEASGIINALSQIGLKLVPEKRTVDYLVVEHAEKEPTAN